MNESENTKSRNPMRLFAVLLTIIGIAALSTFFLKRPDGSLTKSSIRVGLLMPLTGDFSAYGVAMGDAVQLGVDEVNADGGILGQPLELAVEDTKSTPRESLNAFEKLTLQDGVNLVIGPMSSGEVLAVAPAAEVRKVLLFTPSASSPAITAAGDFIFRNVPSDVFEGAAMATVAATGLNLKKVAVLQVNNDYGVGVVAEFKKNLERLGGSVPIIEQYALDVRDFRTPLLRIKESAPSAVLFIGYKEMGVAVAQARELGIDQQFLSTAIFEDTDILAVAGKAAEGIIFTSITFDPQNPSPRAKAFTEAYKAKTGRTPDGYAASAYDALHLVAEAKRHERESILAALKQSGGKVFGPGGAAELLGMKPTTLASRIKALRLNRRTFE
jgi:branched-chain amino acid transport system substrate-binding protein